MRPTQPSPQSSWSHYAKAAAVFTLTTATYLLARTTGWLPGWFNSETSPENTDGSSALTASFTETSIIIPSLSKGGRRDFELQSSSSTLTDLTISEEDIDPSPIQSTQRRLLQQQSLVTVVNPIPDQLIEMGKPYQYSLDNVFSANYTFIKVEQINHQPLPSWLSVQYKQLATVAGRFYNVAVNGSTVFLAGGNGITIIDVTNASAPRILSTLANPVGGAYGTAYGIAISGSVAFIAAQDAGLQIVDISNLSVPYTLSTVPNSHPNDLAVDVAVSGVTAFVADWSGGLQIVDVRNLTSPRVLSTVANNLSGYAWGVAVNGSTVFVAHDSPGLQIVDVSNLTSPRVLSTVAKVPNGRAMGVAVSGSIVFVADNVVGLQIMNVSDLTNPRILATVANNPGGSAEGVTIAGNLVFIADFNAGLQIIDISQASLVGVPPITSTGQELNLVVSAGDTTIPFNTDTFTLTIDQMPRLPIITLADQSIFPGQSKIVPLQSDVLFINPRSSFLRLTVSLFNGDVKPVWCALMMTPVIVNTYVTAGEALGVSVSGSTVFVADYNAGLQILDITNPTMPRVLATVPNSPGTPNNPAFASGVAVSGNTVFVADQGAGLQIVDITDLTAPRVLSTVPNSLGGDASGVAVSGSIVFVADGNAGLQIINITNLTAPRVLSTVPNSLNGWAFKVVVSGSTAFMADRTTELQIIDVTDLTGPRVLSTVPNSPSNYAIGVAVSGSTVFVADSVGLQIIDVTNLTAPRVLSTVPNSPGGSARGVAVSGSTVFVVDDNAGFQIVDVSNLTAPRVLSTVASPNGRAFDVAVSGNTVFVADDTAGLQIIDVSRWEMVLSPGSADGGNYPMRLTVIDDLEGKSHIDFTVRVEGPPELKGNISLQQAWVGQLFNYFVPSNLFVDPNNDVIDYSASLIGGKSLPNWLQFNPLTVGFGGVPHTGDWGNITLTLSATDHICPEIPTVNFTISVGFLPVLSHRIPNQLAPIGSLYQFTVPKKSFFDPAGLALSYLAQGVNNQPLPSWLQFNSTSLLFYGVANTSNITVYTLQLIATNSAGGQVIALFTLRTAHFPVFNKILSVPITSINQPWVWTLPRDAFTDADGDFLTYSATQEDGSVLPSWLSFNPITRTFTGVPLLTGTQGLKMTAQIITAAIIAPILISLSYQNSKRVNFYATKCTGRQIVCVSSKCVQGFW